MTKEQTREYNKWYRETHKEFIRELNKRYREEHKKEIAERMSDYAKNHREEYNKRNREYRHNHKDKHNEQNKKEYKDMKQKVYALFGGKCELCSSTEHLEIHHKNFDGAEERKNGISNSVLFRSLIANGKREDLQLLCSSCHHKVHMKLRRELAE